MKAVLGNIFLINFKNETCILQLSFVAEFREGLVTTIIKFIIWVTVRHHRSPSVNPFNPTPINVQRFSRSLTICHQLPLTVTVVTAGHDRSPPVSKSVGVY